MTEYVYANIYQNIVAGYIVLTSVWQTSVFKMEEWHKHTQMYNIPLIISLLYFLDSGYFKWLNMFMQTYIKILWQAILY